MFRSRKFWLTLLLLFGGCHLLVGPPFYYSEPIRGRVIDEVTGEPAQGAIVIAVWTVSGFSSKVLYAAEGVVGSNGEYEIRGMPPRLRPIGNWFSSLANDPKLHVYKFGYRYEIFLNNIDHPDAHEYPGPKWWWVKRTCYWNGKTLPLQPAKTLEERLDAYQWVYSRVSFHFRNKTSPKRLPHVWERLAVDYHRLPKDPLRQAGIGDPRGRIDRWKRGVRR